jgi:hypothetical protein
MKLIIFFINFSNFSVIIYGYLVGSPIERQKHENGYVTYQQQE